MYAADDDITGNERVMQDCWIAWIAGGVSEIFQILSAMQAQNACD